MLSIPLHVPDVAVKALPRWVVPESVGITVLTGRSPATGLVAKLAWLTLPSGFSAVTSNRTVAPMSATDSV